MKKTVVIGLGNPLLTDDSAGVKVAMLLKGWLADQAEVTVIELSAGGLRLLDAMAGFDRAIILDAMAPVSDTPGAIHSLSLSDLEGTWNTVSLHDMNLPTALALGRLVGMAVPPDIAVWGIEGLDMETFGEEPTPQVARAIPKLAMQVCSDLGISVGQLQCEVL